MKKGLEREPKIVLFRTHQDIRVDVTGLYGNGTGISEDAAGLYRNGTGFSEDVTVIYEDVTVIKGNLIDCDISAAERKEGVDIKDLV